MDAERPRLHQRGRIAPRRWEGAGYHKSVKQPKVKRMAVERQGESRVTRRTQNSQESIDSQEGAGQPQQLQAVSVEHRRQLHGDLWGSEHNS